jgi:hypothetical protein
MTTESPPIRKKKSCYLKGCFILLALVGAGVILFAGIVVLAFFYLRSYTAAEPTAFPAVVAQPLGPETSYGSLSMDENGDQRVALTGDDINQALAAIMRDAPLKTRFRIEKSQVFADFTMPVDHALAKLPVKKIPGFSRRHLNGTITFTPTLEKGVVHLGLQNATLNNKPLSKKMQMTLQKQLETGLNTTLQGNYATLGYLLLIRKMEVKDDQLILHMVNIAGGE